MLAHSYQLLAQLTAIKGMLLVRRARLDLAALAAPLTRTVAAIERVLEPQNLATGDGVAAVAADAPSAATLPDATLLQLHDPLTGNLTPWMLRRLLLSSALAAEVRTDAAALHGGPARGAVPGPAAN